MNILYKELSNDQKAVIWLAEAFDKVLIYLNSEHISLGFRVAFSSTASGIWVYTLKNIKEFDKTRGIDEDCILNEYYGDSSSVVLKNLTVDLPESYDKVCDSRVIGQFDSYTKAYAVPISEENSFNNLEIIKEIFIAFVYNVRGTFNNAFFEKMESIDVSNVDAYEISRTAVLNILSDRVLGKKATIKSNEFYEALCLIASAPYEGAQNHGVLRCKNETVKGKAFVEFKTPVEIRRDNVRQIRKLLEMSSEKNALVIDEGKLIGIYKQDGSAGTGIRFKGNGKWQLYTNITDPLIQFNAVTFELIDQSLEERVMRSLKSVFGNKNYDAIIWIVKMASKQKHGTTIIVSENAEEESRRLAEFNRAIMIDPVQIDDAEVLLSLTAIDGALMADITGKCFAIGVILDGEALSKGNTARGARYNSAITYVDYWKKDNGAVAIVVSADDSVDVYPVDKNPANDKTIGELKEISSVL